MADMDPAPPAGLRERKKEDARQRIADAVLALVAQGTEVNHDRVADLTGIARRTVYRYFPDRETLMQTAWSRMTEMAGPRVAFPDGEAELVASLPEIYEGFDRIADLATVVRSTPQGRALRLSQRKRRIDSYTAAMADAVRDLPPEDRPLATAVIQVLHTTPWLEMRDHWGFDSQKIARACGWAIRTLLADLRSRDGRPLDEDSPAAS